MRRRLAVLMWRVVAVLAFGLGLLGVVLPVMPTVPFLIVAAWAASQGWPAFETWLLAHRLFGPPLVRWRERGAVPRRAKWASSLMMALSAAIMMVLTMPLWAKVSAPLLMAGVAVWLWRRPEH